jgi:protein TonB
MKKLFFTTALFFSISTLFASNNLIDSVTHAHNTDDSIIICDKEVMPSFPGGVTALYKFIRDNLNYPEEAVKQKLEGKVYVKFYVDTDGSVKEPVVLKDGVGGGCAEEAIRIVNSMPKWNPGFQKGKPVKVYFTLPLSFKFEKSKD